MTDREWRSPAERRRRSPSHAPSTKIRRSFSWTSPPPRSIRYPNMKFILISTRSQETKRPYISLTASPHAASATRSWYLTTVTSSNTVPTRSFYVTNAENTANCGTPRRSITQWTGRENVPCKYQSDTPKDFPSLIVPTISIS